MSQLRVGLYIPLAADGTAGGIQQYVIGLIEGLTRQNNDSFEYVLITSPFHPNWLKTYAGDSMHIEPRPPNGFVEQIGAWLGPLRPKLKPYVKPALHLWHDRKEISVPKGSSFFNSLNLDVIHFPTQRYVQTDTDSVYNPHDLQHLHLPEFFDEQTIRERETIYRAGCENANVIGVASNWVKHDIIEQYNIDDSKIIVIPTAPPIEAYPDIQKHNIITTREKYDLPDSFGFYPAQSWPHKNHERLIQALARLRDDLEISVNLVFTGKKNQYWSTVAKTIKKYSLGDQITHLGFVSATELRVLYRLSTFTVIPTLFEAASLPMFEAWHEESPVACSNVTSLPEFAGNAAEMFDPRSLDDIARAIEVLATDEHRRKELVNRGKKRGKKFSWKKTAAKYKQIYRAVAEGTVCTDVSDSTIPIEQEMAQ